MLTENQKEMILNHDGPMLVTACPGAGKTESVVKRVAVLLEVHPDSRILLSTFSDDASKEMINRLELLAEKGKVNVNVKCCTLHSLAYQIASNYYRYSKDVIIKEDEICRLFYECMDKKDEINHVIHNIPQIASEILIFGHPRFTEEKNAAKYSHLYVEAIPRYKFYKEMTGKRDFGDFVIDALKALEDAETLRIWQERFQYILIDEAQDMDPLQAKMCYKLAEKHRNICLIGDDDQSIYGYRGGGVNVFRQFENYFDEYKLVKLEQNFRTPESVTMAANRLINHNINRISKRNISQSHNRVGVTYKRFDSFLNQNRFVVDQINELLNQGVSPNQISILYRTRRSSEQITSLLLENNVPFQIKESDMNYYQNVFFQDILAYYRIANEEEEPGDLSRVFGKPDRGVVPHAFSQYTYKKLQKQMLEGFPNLHEKNAARKFLNDINALKACADGKHFVEILLGEIGYQRWAEKYIEESDYNFIYLQQQFEIITHQAKMYPTINHWKEAVYNYGKVANKVRPYQSALTLSTFHAAKGLEWDYVFVINAVEGIAPIQQVIENENIEKMEEERRAFYVAITRVRKKLYVTTVARGRIKASRFVKEMKGALSGTDPIKKV